MITLKSFFLFTVMACMSVAGSGLAADWNPPADTGQTKCYDVSGNEIVCPAKGQPLYGQDAQHYGPSPSYTENGDGTVTDNNTGLIWMMDTADTNGDSSITSDDQLPRPDAIDYCTALGSGWRLPERFELRSIVDYSRYNPAIDTAYFSCQSSSYWSATSYASNTSNAWSLHFYNGYDVSSNTANSLYVRCVRTGQ